MARPTFNSLWDNYPHGSADAVKALIGGNVNLAWVTNTCVIRISRAMNDAGYPIPGDYPGLDTARGADGKRYAFRVSEFKTYLTKEWGPAEVEGTSWNQFPDHGLILFEVDAWSDATGHFDLWDGRQAAHQPYFSESRTVKLWKLP